MDEYAIKLQVLEELREAIKVKQINDELLEHLHSTLIWTIRYCRKNNIPFPNKEILLGLLQRVEKILNQMPYSLPTNLKQPDKTTTDGSESIIRFC